MVRSLYFPKREFFLLFLLLFFVVISPLMNHEAVSASSINKTILSNYPNKTTTLDTQKNSGFRSSFSEYGLDFAISSNSACPPTNCTEGKNVGEDFMEGVLDFLGIPVTDFAKEALMVWKPYENTNACWNPLATTKKMTDICNFNSVGVQHYQTKEMGMTATANTLSQYQYTPIRAMLSLEGFDRQAITQSLGIWGTCKGTKCDSLLNKWFDLYNNQLSDEDDPLDSGTTSTASVLLIDTSGSMNEQDITGYSKIEAAQRATRSILDVIKTENMSGLSYLHQVGVVSFDNTATLGVNLTNDLTSVESVIDRLYAYVGTGMADGLRMAIDMLSPVDPSFNKMTVLLSDGMPNIGLNSSNDLAESEIIDELINLSSEAKSSGICIHTIGFGLPGQIGGVSGEDSINEGLLKQIASESGCGNYYNASNANELANAFIEIRHASLGQILFSQQGVISQNETLDLGSVPVADDQELILITLNWPGSQLDLELTDPAGVVVDSNYPNASVNASSSIVSMAVTEPMAGNWRVKVFGADVPERQTDYKVLFSARVKPKLPVKPAVIQPDKDITTTNGLSAILVVVLIAASVVLVTKYSSTKKKGPEGKFTSQAYLIRLSTTAPQNMIPLSKQFVIGRRSTANLHLDSSDISRDHAQIYFSGGKWYIHDMNSRLGTYVNGHAVKISPLSSGDRIKIGKDEWIFHITT